MNPVFKSTPIAAAIFLALNSTLVSSPAVAAIGDTVGSEFPVNTFTTGNQSNPSIALDADGDFVIAWESSGQDGAGDGIYAQRYTANGIAAGSEFLVNTFTTGSQSNPSIALNADGDFVIAWESSGQDGAGDGIYAQRYTANGIAAGSEFLVNTFTTSNQSNPSIALDADGDFVIAWESNGQDGDSEGIYAQRYTADGIAAGSEFLVNTFTTSSQSNPSIALDADGDFVIAWESDGQDGAGGGIYAQRYTADGIAAGNEFLVNAVTTDDQFNPSIALDADGDFVIAWVSSGQDGAGDGIYAQRYTANGIAAGSEFPVNTFTTSNQSNPSIALDADGDFVFAWQSNGQDGNGNGVYAQRYTADGIAAGSEFPVNTFTTNDQTDPSIALDADGDFVIAWQSDGQDGNGSGVHAQRYEGAGETVDLNLVVQDDTDPVTVGNNFTYSLITTNNGTGIAMDVNLSEPIPTGLTYVSDDSATSGWACTQAATTLNCNKPFMSAAEVNTIMVSVTASSAGTLSNTVTATAAQTDANATDNTDTETTTVDVTPTPTTPPTTSSGGGGGALGGFSLLMTGLLWLRRRYRR